MNGDRVGFSSLSAAKMGVVWRTKAQAAVGSPHPLNNIMEKIIKPPYAASVLLWKEVF